MADTALFKAPLVPHLNLKLSQLRLATQHVCSHARCVYRARKLRLKKSSGSSFLSRNNIFSLEEAAALLANPLAVSGVCVSHRASIASCHGHLLVSLLLHVGCNSLIRMCRRLLEKATELSPIDVNSPSTLAVAILKPGKTSEDELVSDDFIW